MLSACKNYNAHKQKIACFKKQTIAKFASGNNRYWLRLQQLKQQ